MCLATYIQEVVYGFAASFISSELIQNFDYVRPSKVWAKLAILLLIEER